VLVGLPRPDLVMEPRAGGGVTGHAATCEDVTSGSGRRGLDDGWFRAGQGGVLPRPARPPGVPLDSMIEHMFFCVKMGGGCWKPRVPDSSRRPGSARGVRPGLNRTASPRLRRRGGRGFRTKG